MGTHGKRGSSTTVARVLAPLIVLAALALTACGGSGTSPSPAPSAAPMPSQAAHETMTVALANPNGEIGSTEVRKDTTTGEYEMQGTDGSWHAIGLTFCTAAVPWDVHANCKRGSGFTINADQDVYFTVGTRVGIIHLREPVPWDMPISR